MRNRYLVITNVILLLLSFACSNKGIMYDPAQKRSIYFYKDVSHYITGVVPDTVQFSFAAMDESMYQYDIPVKFIGMPADVELTCDVEIVPDSTTAVRGKHFEMGKAIFSKNKVDGILSIQLFRTEDLMGQTVTLYFRLKEDDYFVPMENAYFLLSITDGVLVAPSWWPAGYFGVYENNNHLLYRKILENYWELETLKPVFYTETVKEYGRYLEKAPVGFFQLPGNMIWIKYVLKPAYEFYCDPANTYEGFTMENPDSFIR